MSLCPPVFDHLTLNARDALADCCQSLEAMGFSLTPPSYQSIGAVNRCAIMQGAYLEVIAINPQAEQPRKELLEQSPGLNALVFRIDDAEACFAAFKAAGLPVLPAQQFSRMTSDSAGRPAEAGFRVVRFEAGWAARAFPFGRVYFCQHLTPGLIFDPGFVRHANGCTSFSGVDIEVRDLAALSPLMNSLFGASWRYQTGAPGNDQAAPAQGLLGAGHVAIRFRPGTRDRITACAFDAGTARPQLHESPYGQFRF